MLTGSAEKLFTMCDEYADNQRRKSQVWPLQNTLLILCPVSNGCVLGDLHCSCVFLNLFLDLQHILRDIAESGIDNPSGPHKAQVSYILYT